MIINEGRPGKKLPALTNPGVAGDLLTGKQLIGADGQIITGTMASVVQATPSISVSTNGLITASATQSAGRVAAGTKSATKQLTTQAGKTVTPGRTKQTAVASGRYTTGTVYVAGDSDLVAANIKKGVNIFGVAGTYEANPTFYMRALNEISRSGNTVTVEIKGGPNSWTCVFAYIARDAVNINDMEYDTYDQVISISFIVNNFDALTYARQIVRASPYRAGSEFNTSGYSMTRVDDEHLRFTFSNAEQIDSSYDAFDFGFQGWGLFLA